MLKIQNFKTANEYASKAANAIESFISDQLDHKKVVRIALSGGKSPVPVYRELGKRNINWSRVALFLVDERYVPLNSSDSNYGMIKESLTDHVSNLRKFYHYNTRKPIATIVGQYQKLLEQFESPLFDLVILGLGADGHTASLFPGSEASHEKRRLVMHTKALDQNTQDRMTLTFSAIMDSEKIIFLISGAEKEGVVNELANENPTIDELPAAKILEHPDVEIFYLR